MKYVKPDTSVDYRADARECLDRAQRALEVAEINLDTVAELMNGRGATTTELIAHAKGRTELGGTWVDLAAAKSYIEDVL